LAGPKIEPIAAQEEAMHAALLALNNAHARETSFLSLDGWQSLTGNAYAATCVAGAAALLIAFDQDADYDGVNFQWFRARLDRFVYVDRIVVAESHRGTGLARTMYHDLFRRMRASGQSKVTCEVNVVPPNPGSDAFHARLGFIAMGQAELVDGEKTVRYLIKDLA
jgi:predicted GNAT superfamily acetyltransferase